MALLHDHSCPCTLTQLDLFTIPPTQTAITAGNWDEYHPISNLLDGSPIEFNVAGTPEEYVDLSQTKLHIKAKITNGDGTQLAVDAPVAPNNLFLQSLFSQCEVSLNERLVSPSSNNYPYRAYLETLLNYSRESKETQLTSSLFYKDEASKFDECNPLENDAAVANSGLKERYTLSARSRLIDMTGPIHSDIFFQDKLLLNSIDLKVKLTPSQPEFCLLSSNDQGNYKVSITHASLLVRKVRVNPSISLGHAKALEMGNARYPLTRVDTKAFSVPAGTMSYSKDNLFLGQLPQRIVIGLVDNDAYNGVLGKNCFNFKNMNLNYLSLTVDGMQLSASKPLTPKYTIAGGQSYIQAYQTLYSGLNKMYKDSGNNISREEYPNGYTLYAFDITPDLNEGGHLNLVRKGNLRLEMRFGNALPETAMVVVFSEFQNILEVDRARNIIFDYNV
ncbi:uncharacterized protein F54H12.2-like [Amphiura filiformis]|uniref:uncharacterized protein F54H12.2-like n=1 Tax=Amphiura filiformis TaxID=82378 RepID=UPI003B218BD2